MNVRLHLSDGRTIAVDRPLVVGRLPECDVVIGDSLVSGRHFEVAPGPGGALLNDLGSSNGTYVGGEKLSGPAVLVGGEEISIGSQRITVERVVETEPIDLRLFVRVGPDAGRSAEVGFSEALVIGRGDDVGLKLSDPLVSARHCSVTLTRPPVGPCPHCGTVSKPGDAHCVGCGRIRVAAEVLDLGSANGVLVDGALVPMAGRADLLEGGEIQLGDTVLVFGSESDPVSTGPAPTVIRKTPEAIRVPVEVPAAAPKRRIPTMAWVLGIVAILAIAFVALAVIGSGDGQSGQQHDAAWVMANEGSTTVQVFACDGATKASCDASGSSGSGSVVDLGAGLVLTNFHVIANDSASEPLPNLTVGISITGETVEDAEVVGYSACDDLALLRITGDAKRFNLSQVEFAAPDSLQTGEGVVVLGYPGTIASADQGDEPLQLTTGSISALGVHVEHYLDLIQTDAPINHGNSGGPMFDLEGRQIGVAALGDEDGTQGIHYAISVAQVQKVLPGMKSGTRQSGLSSCPKS